MQEGRAVPLRAGHALKEAEIQAGDARSTRCHPTCHLCPLWAGCPCATTPSPPYFLAALSSSSMGKAHGGTEHSEISCWSQKYLLAWNAGKLQWGAHGTVKSESKYPWGGGMQAEGDLLPSGIQNYPPLPPPIPICASWFSCQQVMRTRRKKRQNTQALECRAHSISAASAASCHGPGISLPILKPTPPVADPRTRVPQGELAALHAAQERGCPWRVEMPAPFLLIAGSSTVQEKLQKLPDLHLCSARPGVQGPSALQSRRWKGRTNTKGGEQRPGAE